VSVVVGGRPSTPDVNDAKKQYCKVAIPDGV
jgi:hypothetical protein